MHLTRRHLIAAGAALPFLSSGRARAAEPGTLVFGLSAYPPSFSVWGHTGTAAMTAKLMTHRGLLSFGPTGDIQPEIAESYAPAGDAGWTFRLRDNVVFHDGRPLTSADVAWTFTAMGAETSTAYSKSVMQMIGKIETPDARTVTVTLKEPLAVFPLVVALPHSAIVPKDTVFDRTALPVGNGPYKLAGQERGVALEFEKFDRFYKPGLPKTAKVRMTVYADETLRVSALKSGNVDLIEYVPWQAMGEIEADPRLKLESTFGPFMYLIFNGSGPFGDKRLRQAVAYAVQRDDIVRTAFFGRAAPLEGMPLPETSPFYDPATAKALAYDPAKSKALLAAAGHPNGFSCKLLSNAQYGMHRSTAEMVQQSLAAVGIKVDLNLPDWSTYTTLANRGQYDLAVVGNAADNNDPDGLASLLDATLAPSYVRSTKLDQPQIRTLLTEGRRELDPAKRKTIYDKLQTAFIDDLPIVPLAARSQGYAMKKGVTGFSNMPGQLTFFSGATLETTVLA